MATHRNKQAVKKRRLLMAISGFLLGTFLIALGTIIVYVSGGIEWIDISFPGSDLFLGIVLMAVLAGAEEFIFRRVVLRKVARLSNKWIALIVSSVLFAAVHLANSDISVLGIINVFIGGLVFGMVYLLSRSLVHVIFFHFAWNLWQGPLLGFPVSGFPFESVLSQEITGSQLISGGAFGFEGSIICTIILLLVFTGGCWLFLQKHQKRSVVAGAAVK